MNNVGLNGVSAVALAVALGAMAVALWRARRSPQLSMSMEQALARRVDELENEVANQRATITTLQKLLYEKENQNGRLVSEVATLNERVRELERQQPTPGERADRPVLLVVLGEDQALAIDMAMLRTREIKEHFRLMRRRNPSKRELADMLRRHRSQGTPVAYVHFAVHASAQGVALGGELADGVWLSETLQGVDVAVLAGCATAAVGDLLRVVPAVVSLTEEVDNADAAAFTLAFWSLVAGGRDPEEAFYEALDRSPANVAEFAELHV